jgi:hypothetical protein
LPNLLDKALNHFDERNERDIFLTASLPVLAGCMPNVWGQYNRKWYTPDLYTTVVASPASGKGAADPARKLGEKVDAALRDQNEMRLDDDRLHGDLSTTPGTGLFAPGNASARALFDTVYERESKVVIFQTEIDSLANANKQEWGGFDQLLRKAFHHEPASLNRKDIEAYVEKPEISLFLSGTENQFVRLMKSPESGLYSRFALYYTTSAPEWKSQRPTDKDKQITETFEALSKRMLVLYNDLTERSVPLRFRLRDKQWDLHDEKFSARMSDLKDEEMSHMASVVKRAGLIAFRIAMILSVLRAREHEAGLADDEREVIEPVQEDFEMALELALTYADHGIQYSRKLHDASAKAKLPAQAKRFFSLLPDEFKTSDAQETGDERNIPDRTVRNYLKRFVDNDLAEKVKKGHYEKL